MLPDSALGQRNILRIRKETNVNLLFDFSVFGRKAITRHFICHVSFSSQQTEIQRVQYLFMVIEMVPLQSQNSNPGLQACVLSDLATCGQNLYDFKNSTQVLQVYAQPLIKNCKNSSNSQEHFQKGFQDQSILQEPPASRRGPQILRL